MADDKPKDAPSAALPNADVLDTNANQVRDLIHQALLQLPEDKHPNAARIAQIDVVTSETALLSLLMKGTDGQRWHVKVSGV